MNNDLGQGTSTVGDAGSEGGLQTQDGDASVLVLDIAHLVALGQLTILSTSGTVKVALCRAQRLGM